MKLPSSDSYRPQGALWGPNRVADGWLSVQVWPNSRYAMWKPSVTVGQRQKGAGAAFVLSKDNIGQWRPLSLLPGLLQWSFLQQLLHKPLSSRENKCLALCQRAKETQEQISVKEKPVSLSSLSSKWNSLGGVECLCMRHRCRTKTVGRDEYSWNQIQGHQWGKWLGTMQLLWVRMQLFQTAFKVGIRGYKTSWKYLHQYFNPKSSLL